jgi:hypothetical protein
MNEADLHLRIRAELLTELDRQRRLAADLNHYIRWRVRGGGPTLEMREQREYVLQQISRLAVQLDALDGLGAEDADTDAADAERGL